MTNVIFDGANNHICQSQEENDSLKAENEALFEMLNYIDNHIQAAGRVEIGFDSATHLAIVKLIQTHSK